MTLEKTTDQCVGRPMASGHRRAGFTLVELLIVFVIVVLLSVVGSITVRHFEDIREVRSICSFHLREIGLALQKYEEAHGVLPPAVTRDAQGRRLHSWRTLILPYLEVDPRTRAILDTIDLSKPWDDPVNARAGETRVVFYHCPASTGPENTTTYFASCGEDGCFAPHDPRRMSDITDEPGDTLMLVEAGSHKAAPWMKPVDADATAIDRLIKGQPTHNTRGGHALMADQSLRFLRTGTDAAVLRKMATIAGGEAISPEESPGEPPRTPRVGPAN